jgi:hypothetical protein
MKSACHNSPVKKYTNGNYCSVCFQEQYQTEKYTRVLYVLLSITLLLASASVKAPSISETPGEYSVYFYGAADILPADSTLLVELVKNSCVLASVAVAQARIESANYTSDIAVNNKNLFGIKVHNCKYVAGERKGHATFASYKDNIACYCHIQQRYLNKIDKSYAEDPLYIQKVKQMR